MKPQATVEMAKRAADLAIGLFGTFIFLLAYPFLALIIKLESPGPALYNQARVGRDRRANRDRRNRDALPPGTERRWSGDRRSKDVGGRVFTIQKFRTMRMDAEKAGPQLCGKGGDSRVTKAGNILRKLHLDELPQFWSVLKGDMSFIGPRPERPHFTVQYAEQVPYFMERTRGLKPGILGLAQIVNGYDDGVESVVRKTRFDLAYRASMSSFTAWLRLEAWILANTFLYYATSKPLSQTRRLPSFPVPEGMGPEVFRPTLKPVLSAAGLPAAVLPADAQPEPAPLQAEPVSMDARRRVRPTLAFLKEGKGAEAGDHRPSAGRGPEAAPSAPGATEGIRNFFTIDVECWFHAHNLGIPKSQWDREPSKVVENVRRILDLLKAHGSKATFFTLGYVADRFPELVRMIDEAGHEIGTHGYMHDKVTDMTPYDFEKDLDRSLNALAKRTGRRIIGHRASNFSIVEGTLWALDILARYGIEYDSSIFPVQRGRYGIPAYPNRMPHTVHLRRGATIHEIPMSTLKMGSTALPISGGGYLRLYPYAVTDLFIRHRNGQGLPAMVYFHPWELDASQERIRTGMLKGFQHYVNLDTTAWKLDRLLGRHSFTSVEENLRSGPVRSMLDADPVRLRVSGAAARQHGAAASHTVAGLSNRMFRTRRQILEERTALAGKAPGPGIKCSG